jgi:uncharacterized protein YydD (DUF2326 family)
MTRDIIPNSLHPCYREEPVAIRAGLPEPGKLLSATYFYHANGGMQQETITFYKSRDVITKFKRMPDGGGQAVTRIDIVKLSRKERRKREKEHEEIRAKWQKCFKVNEKMYEVYTKKEQGK